MASVLLLSIHGNGISVAHRLAQEGHIVKTYFHENETPHRLQGVRNPSVVRDPRKMLDQYDLILCDQAGVGLICDELASAKPVIGGGTFHDKLMSDSFYKQRVILASCQMEVTPPKPAAGTEMWVEGWFTSSGWAASFTLTLTHTRLMPADIGPQMPCMGCVVFHLTKCKLTNTLLEPFTALLTKLNYLGPFSVHFSVSDDSSAAQIHDIHAGFSFDSFQAMSELIPCSLFDYLYSLSNGSVDKHLLSSTSMAVRLLVRSSEAHELIQLDDGAKKHVWVTDELAQHTDNVCTVTARGLSVRECQRRVYRTVRNICVSPDVMYRNDIGLGAEERAAELRSQGWFEAPAQLMEEAQSA